MADKFESFLKIAGGNEGQKCHYATRLDLYGCGCQHNCSYCYARALLAFRGLWNPLSPKVAAISEVKASLAKIPSGSIVRLGGMTDCFQPLEEQEKVTYETIHLLNRARIGYLIVTKSALVARDNYIMAMDRDLAHIQITITSTDDALAGTYENATPPSERIKAIEKLQKAGFDVSIRLLPFIPEYIDKSKINAIKCDKLLIEFLRGNGFIKKTFPIDWKPYRLKQHGYRQLPLEAKRKLIQGFTIPQQTVCDDIDEHVKYWHRSFNYNKDDCCNLRRSKT